MKRSDSPINGRGQLHHRFAAGLRFDTRAQYLNAAKRWRNLPVSESLYADLDHGAIAAMQALALLTGRYLLPSSESIPSPGNWLAARLPGYEIQRVTGTLMRYWPRIVARTLRSGGVALVRLLVLRDLASTPHWGLVIGVEEYRRIGNKAQVRALLMLDATRSSPWVCGYNVRLIPPECDGRSSSWTYRTLDGQRWQVRMIEGISLRLSTFGA
jgi:hypothetical protein